MIMEIIQYSNGTIFSFEGKCVKLSEYGKDIRVFFLQPKSFFKSQKHSSAKRLSNEQSGLPSINVIHLLVIPTLRETQHNTFTCMTL